MSAPTLTPDPGYCGDIRRGASLGRRSQTDDVPVGRFYLRRLYLNSGGYDSGGVYWGIGAPMWWACDSEGNCNLYFRSTRDRADAKAVVRQSFPAAEFFR